MLTAGACEPERIQTAIPIPAERTDCPTTVARPTVPAESLLDWSIITTLQQARAAVEALIGSVRARERVVADHVLKLEGVIFECGNDDQWVRDYQRNLPQPQ